MNTTQYFTHSLHSYAPKNKKASEMVDFAESLQYTLIEEESGATAFLALMAFLDEIDAEISRLNLKYPRQKTMMLEKFFQYERIRAYFPSPDTNTDNEETVFVMTVSEVKHHFKACKTNN